MFVYILFVYRFLTGMGEWLAKNNYADIYIIK